MIDAQAYPVLVLNADGTPVAVRGWREAVEDLVRGAAYAVAEYAAFARSPSRSIAIPSVIALRDYEQTHRQASFTRRNLFLAYRLRTAAGPAWRCALSGVLVHDSEDLTLEHVLPRSRGGRSTWDNVVLATAAMNNRKGDRTLEEAGMRLHVTPLRPTLREVAAASIRSGWRAPPSDWVDHLGHDYWDVEVEP